MASGDVHVKETEISSFGDCRFDLDSIEEKSRHDEGVTIAANVGIYTNLFGSLTT